MANAVDSKGTPLEVGDKVYRSRFPKDARMTTEVVRIWPNGDVSFPDLPGEISTNGRVYTMEMMQRSDWVKQPAANEVKP